MWAKIQSHPWRGPKDLQMNLPRPKVWLSQFPEVTTYVDLHGKTTDAEINCAGLVTLCLDDLIEEMKRLAIGDQNVEARLLDADIELVDEEIRIRLKWKD